MAKAVIRKPKKESAEEVPENPEWVAHCFEFRHQFLVGVKKVEGGELVEDVGTWEEVQEEIREILKKRFPHGHFTPSGGYLLIHEDDNRVRACYPHDFDYDAMARKPGTHPPLYTLSQEEQKEVRELQRAVEERAQREKKRELETGNGLATNPRNLLTTQETDRLQRITKKKVVRAKPEEVEWDENDVADETIAEEETAKLLGSGAKKIRRVVKRK